jgi:hypothetical protein
MAGAEGKDWKVNVGIGKSKSGGWIPVEPHSQNDIPQIDALAARPMVISPPMGPLVAASFFHWTIGDPFMPAKLGAGSAGPFLLGNHHRHL